MLMREIMTTRVATVAMDDRLSVIREIFEQAHFRHLLVVEAGTLMGVISDRDLLRALSPYFGTEAELTRDTETLNRRAHQIMSRQPVTIAPDRPLLEAARLMLERHISCLPVLESGVLVGILSWCDLLRVMLEGAPV